ncbi:MAG: polysaccharide deacetylase family protein [Gaiellaceae bacterium]
MRHLLIAVMLLVVAVPAAVAAMQRPPAVGWDVPRLGEQHRAVAEAFARGGPVSCGGGHGDAVALTFDDGPGPYTARILDVLRAYGAHATFFVVGNRIDYWPEAAREEAQLGGIGNHTWSHPALTRLPHPLVWLELMRTQYVVGTELGMKPRLFRTPYALHSRATDEIVRRLGLVEVFWDVDARDDVHGARVADIVRNVRRGLRPGAIIVMHDIHSWTLKALPRVLKAIRARGLRAVSVPELLALDPPSAGQRCPYTAVGRD